MCDLFLNWNDTRSLHIARPISICDKTNEDIVANQEIIAQEHAVQILSHAKGISQGLHSDSLNAPR